uniref:Uncharacterized protein n=1 Tax=Amphimedon queenslandica TaxID=400682 RepID=A0A1X7V997_AMPQE
MESSGQDKVLYKVWIDISGASDDSNLYNSVPAEELPLDLMLPSSADYQNLAYNFSVLLSHVLVKKLPYFATTFHDVFIQHLPNEQSEKMAQKYEKIPLGVISENDNEKIPIPAHKVHKVSFGGDMLTWKRAETTIECCQKSTTLLKQLKGLHPICDDWHAKKCLLEAEDEDSRKTALQQVTLEIVLSFVDLEPHNSGNIPGDLHMEHLNRLCKVAVANLEANITPAALKRVGKCLGILHKLTCSFDHDLGVSDIFELIHFLVQRRI